MQQPVTRVFNIAIVITVYIPPHPSATVASEILLNCVHKHENNNPEGIMMVQRDFNHCRISQVYQHINRLLRVPQEEILH